MNINTSVSEAFKPVSLKEISVSKFDKKDGESFLAFFDKFLKSGKMEKGGKLVREKVNEENEGTSSDTLNTDYLTSFLKDFLQDKSVKSLAYLKTREDGRRAIAGSKEMLASDLGALNSQAKAREGLSEEVFIAEEVSLPEKSVLSEQVYLPKEVILPEESVLPEEKLSINLEFNSKEIPKPKLVLGEVEAEKIVVDIPINQIKAPKFVIDIPIEEVFTVEKLSKDNLAIEDEEFILETDKEELTSKEVEAQKVVLDTPIKEVEVSKAVIDIPKEKVSKVEEVSKGNVSIKGEDFIVETNKENQISKEVQAPKAVIDIPKEKVSKVEKVSKGNVAIEDEQIIFNTDKKELISKEVERPKVIVDSPIEEVSKEEKVSKDNMAIDVEQLIVGTNKENLISKEVQAVKEVIDTPINQVSKVEKVSKDNLAIEDEEFIVKTNKDNLISKEVEVPKALVDIPMEEVSKDNLVLEDEELIVNTDKVNQNSKEVERPKAIVDTPIEKVSKVEKFSKDNLVLEDEKLIIETDKVNQNSKEIERPKEVIDTPIEEVSKVEKVSKDNLVLEGEKLNIETDKANQNSKEIERPKEVIDTPIEEVSKVEKVSKDNLVLEGEKLILETDKVNQISKEAETPKAIVDTPIEEVSRLEDDLDKIVLEGDRTKGKEDVEKPDKKTDSKVNTLEMTKGIDSNFMMNRIQNSFLNVNEMNDKLSLENLQVVKDSIIDFMEISKEGDTSLMKLRLYPEELGSIDISLKLREGKLIADIVVGSEKTKELFLNSHSILNKALAEKNIAIKSINISVNDAFNSFEGFNGERRRGQARKGYFQRQAINRSLGGNLNLDPLNAIRISKVNSGSESLNILV